MRPISYKNVFKGPHQSKPTAPWWPCDIEHWPWTRPFEFVSHHFKPNVTSQIQAEQGVGSFSQEFLWLPLHLLVLSCQVKEEHNTGEEPFAGRATSGAHEQKAASQDSCHLAFTAPFKHSLNLVWKHILVSPAHFDIKLERAANLSSISFHVWVIIPYSLEGDEC